MTSQFAVSSTSSAVTSSSSTASPMTSAAAPSATSSSPAAMALQSIKDLLSKATATAFQRFARPLMKRIFVANSIKVDAVDENYFKCTVATNCEGEVKIIARVDFGLCGDHFPVDSRIEGAKYFFHIFVNAFAEDAIAATVPVAEIHKVMKSNRYFFFEGANDARQVPWAYDGKSPEGVQLATINYVTQRMDARPYLATRQWYDEQFKK